MTLQRPPRMTAQMRPTGRVSRRTQHVLSPLVGWPNCLGLFPLGLIGVLLKVKLLGQVKNSAAHFLNPEYIQVLLYCRNSFGEMKREHNAHVMLDEYYP